MLAIQQGSFKSLDTLSFGVKDMGVFARCQCGEINWSVVGLNAIEMMNLPSGGQVFIIRCFPNNYVFWYITIIIGSRVARLHYHYVSRGIFNPATLPGRCSSPAIEWSMLLTMFSLVADRFATSGARMFMGFIPLLRSSFTIISFIHIISIEYTYNFVKQGCKFVRA